MKKAQPEAGRKAGVDVTLLDQWIAEHSREPEGILGREGLLAQLTKALVGEGGKVEIAIPRDRQSTFEPRLIAQGQKRFEGFDEKTSGCRRGG